MIYQIDTHAGVPIYRQIMDQLRRQILTGQMSEGEQIEQVRKLAARLKVNPMTISKAYAFLEQEGLLERRRGVGLFVASVATEKQSDTKKQLLDEAISKAAAEAIEMEVSEAEAIQIFQEHYRDLTSRKKGAQS